VLAGCWVFRPDSARPRRLRRSRRRGCLTLSRSVLLSLRLLVALRARFDTGTVYELAAKARALMQVNDPDAVRAGLAELPMHSTRSASQQIRPRQHDLLQIGALLGSRAYTKKWAAERLAPGGPVREESMSGQASDPSKRFATSKELGGYLFTVFTAAAIRLCVSISSLNTMSTRYGSGSRPPLRSRALRWTPRTIVSLAVLLCAFAFAVPRTSVCGTHWR
jgi:hypothetical protein